MLAWRTNYIQILSICLGFIAVICNFTTTSAATVHSYKKKINVKESGQGASKNETLDQQSLTTYDQRQNGKFNINVNIKDVKIIYSDRDEFEGSLNDDTIYDYGDYDYDPSHLTVSPLPIFGIGSVYLTSSKPPKLSTELPISTINYITKHTTGSPQPTTITNLPVTSNIITSTTRIHAPNLDAAMLFPQKQPSKATLISSDNLLSSDSTISLFSKNNGFTTGSIETTVKPHGIVNTVKVQTIPPSNRDMLQNVPVDVTVKPYI